MSTIVFFATIADVPKDHPLYAQRKQQYENAFAKVFSYSTPVHSVISETNQETQDLLQLPFTSLKIIPSTNAYNCINKSMREYTSMQLALPTTLADDTWVIKLSGRYLITDDTFFNTVKSAPDTCHFVGMLWGFDINDIQVYTFFYAIRYNYLAKFLKDPNTMLWSKNVEKHLFEFLHKQNIYDTAIFVDHLGIYVNIADSAEFIRI